MYIVLLGGGCGLKFIFSIKCPLGKTYWQGWTKTKGVKLFLIKTFLGVVAGIGIWIIAPCGQDWVLSGIQFVIGGASNCLFSAIAMFALSEVTALSNDWFLIFNFLQLIPTNCPHFSLQLNLLLSLINYISFPYSFPVSPNTFQFQYLFLNPDLVLISISTVDIYNSETKMD